MRAWILQRCVSRQKVESSHFDLGGLRHHPKYHAALAVMKDKASEVFRNGEPHPWSVVAAIVILSERAREVCWIMDCLLARRHPATRMEVSECLYCIAAALFLFQIEFGINGGLHYRAFNAIHKLESSDIDIADKAESADWQRPSMKFTAEQMRIFSHDLSPSDVIKIVAFAGQDQTEHSRDQETKTH